MLAREHGANSAFGKTAHLLLTCAALVLAFCVVCMVAGCSNSNDDEDIPLTVTEGMGLNIDTKDPAGQEMTLKFYVDERTRYMFLYDYAIERYTEGGSRKNVTIDIEFVSPERVQKMALEGSEDGDALLGVDSVIEKAADDGIIEGGRAYTSLRMPGYLNNNFIVLVKKKGADISKLTTRVEGISEKKAPTDGMWLMGLATLKGTVAIPAEDTLEGQMARTALNYNKLYSEESGQGGEIDPSLDDVVVEYKDAEAVAAAVRSGKCDLGLMGSWQCGHLKGIEYVQTFAEGGYGRTNFAAGSFKASEKGAYARDFLEFMYIMG